MLNILKKNDNGGLTVLGKEVMNEKTARFILKLLQLYALDKYISVTIYVFIVWRV